MSAASFVHWQQLRCKLAAMFDPYFVQIPEDSDMPASSSKPSFLEEAVAESQRIVASAVTARLMSFAKLLSGRAKGCVMSMTPPLRHPGCGVWVESGRRKLPRTPDSTLT